MRALHLLSLLALPLAACAPPAGEPGPGRADTVTLIQQSTRSLCGAVPTAQSALAVVTALYPSPGVIATGAAAGAAREICTALFGAPGGPATRSGPPPPRGTVLTAETARGVAIEAEFVGMSDPAGG